jgi:hypothetical protein
MRDALRSGIAVLLVIRNDNVVGRQRPLDSRFGGPVFVGLNKMFARLPGRWQYPAWWHRFLGAIIVGFGLLFAVTGALLAGRQIQNGP